MGTPNPKNLILENGGYLGKYKINLKYLKAKDIYKHF